jgi:hypothetical protein
MLHRDFAEPSVLFSQTVKLRSFGIDTSEIQILQRRVYETNGLAKERKRGGQA